jgi:hypothetical protein
MKMYEGVDVEPHLFFTSILVGTEGSASLPGRFSEIKIPRYPLYMRLGGPHSSVVKILAPNGTGTLPLNRPARSQSLYSLRYSISTRNMVG